MQNLQPKRRFLILFFSLFILLSFGYSIFAIAQSDEIGYDGVYVIEGNIDSRLRIQYSTAATASCDDEINISYYIEVLEASEPYLLSFFFAIECAITPSLRDFVTRTETINASNADVGTVLNGIIILKTPKNTGDFLFVFQLHNIEWDENFFYGWEEFADNIKIKGDCPLRICNPILNLTTIASVSVLGGGIGTFLSTSKVSSPTRSLSKKQLKSIDKKSKGKRFIGRDSPTISGEKEIINSIKRISENKLLKILESIGKLKVYTILILNENNANPEYIKLKLNTRGLARIIKVLGKDLEVTKEEYLLKGLDVGNTKRILMVIWRPFSNAKIADVEIKLPSEYFIELEYQINGELKKVEYNEDEGPLQNEDNLLIHSFELFDVGMDSTNYMNLVKSFINFVKEERSFGEESERTEQEYNFFRHKITFINVETRDIETKIELKKEKDIKVGDIRFNGKRCGSELELSIPELNSISLEFFSYSPINNQKYLNIILSNRNGEKLTLKQGETHQFGKLKIYNNAEKVNQILNLVNDSLKETTLNYLKNGIKEKLNTAKENITTKISIGKKLGIFLPTFLLTTILTMFIPSLGLFLFIIPVIPTIVGFLIGFFLSKLFSKILLRKKKEKLEI